MNQYSIYSDRHFQKWPSHHIIYEWEDEISKQLKIPIVLTPFINNSLYKKTTDLCRKLFKNDFSNVIDKLKGRKGKYLYFEPSPKSYKNFSNHKNSIPIIIDFWKDTNLELFNKYYNDCSIVLISSKEAFEFLKRNNSPLNLAHFPLSLPDLYKLAPNQIFNKRYDIVFAGRSNPILMEYLKNYEYTHPEIEYLFQEQQNEEFYYRSNKNGVVGKFHSREEYLTLIRSAKISFYTTPGIDGGEKRTGGFNPVTPRLLELLSAGCHVLARYQQNEETDFYELETICPSVNSYEEFKKQMDYAIYSNESPVKRNSEYLLKHYTSTRIDTLRKILNTI